MNPLSPAQNLSVFQAKWPKEPPCSLKKICCKIMRVVWNILSVIIFPIGLIRLTIWWVKDRALRLAIVAGKPDFQGGGFPKTYCGLAKEAIGRVLSPQSYKPNRASEGTTLLREYGGHRVEFKTPDGAHLEGAFFPGKESEKVILYAFGDGEQWDHLDRRRQLSLLKPMGASIFMINPRGIGAEKSRSWCYEKGYALDIYSAYEYLIKRKKIDPENILLVGYSMGSAYGACGAALVQEKYPNKKINLISLRSFSSLQREIKVLTGRVLHAMAWMIGLEMNPHQALKKLKGKKIIFYNGKDPIVPYPASMAKAALKASTTSTIVKMHQHMHSDSPHIRPLCKKERSELYGQIRELLKLKTEEEDLEDPARFCDEPLDLKRITPIFKLLGIPLQRQNFDDTQRKCCAAPLDIRVVA